MDRFPQRAEKRRALLWAFGSFALFLIGWTAWVFCHRRWQIPDLIPRYFSPGDVFWWAAALVLIAVNRRRLRIAPGQMLGKLPAARLLLPFFGAMLLYDGAVMLVQYGGFHINMEHNLLHLLLQFFLVALQEELLFRGFFYNILAYAMPQGRANLVSALFFLLIHLPGWIMGGSSLAAILTTGAGIFVLGLVFGWLFGKSRSLWTPILAHLLWDVCARLL